MAVGASVPFAGLVVGLPGGVADGLPVLVRQQGLGRGSVGYQRGAFVVVTAGSFMDYGIQPEVLAGCRVAERGCRPPGLRCLGAEPGGGVFRPVLRRA